MKLNFGCGEHIIDGWVNADRYTEPPCLELGAVPINPQDRSLPWDDNTFDQVLMAHTIEHIPLGGSIAVMDYAARGLEPPLTVQEVLAELYRVTKPGGSCLFIGPDIKLHLNFWLKMHTAIEYDSTEKPYREQEYWILADLLKPEALNCWLSDFVDPTLVNTRRHDTGISTTKKDSLGNLIPEDRDVAAYSYNEMEFIFETVFQAFFGNFVLEHDIHVGQSDHRWNCYEDRLLSLVSEHFPSLRTVKEPTGVIGVENSRWVDENELEWLTTSWGSFSCAVLATK